MIVQCGHCGAPLDVNETDTIVCCRYRGMKNERARTRTIAERTPADFTPPPKWRPPPEFPADSDKELTYSKGSGGWIGCAIVSLVVVVPCLIAGGAALHDCTGFLGSEPSKLVALETLDGTPQALGAQLAQSTVNESSVWADLYDSRFIRVSFSWDSERMDHPSSFYFGPRGDKPSPADMLLLLGAGYALAGLGKLGPTTTVDRAETEVRKLFPGASIDSSSGVRVKVPLAHASFGRAEFNWNNQRGAKLARIELESFKIGAPLPQASLLACLSKTWMSASSSEIDFMKKTQLYRWSVDGASVELYPERMDITPGAIDSAGWTKLTATIDACR